MNNTEIVQKFLNEYNSNEPIDENVKYFGDFIVDCLIYGEFDKLNILLEKISEKIINNKKVYNNPTLLSIISLSSHAKYILPFWLPLKYRIKEIFLEEYGEERTRNMFVGLES